MNKTMEILRNEIYLLVSRFSFWFGTLGVPLIGVLIFGVVSAVNNSQGGAGPSPLEGVGQIFNTMEETRPQGYVDQAGLIEAYPQRFDHEALIPYESVEQARAELDSDTISAFYVVPPDYLGTGQVTVYSKQFNLISTASRSEMLRTLIEFNLLGGDEALFDMQRAPITELVEVNVSPEPAAGPERDDDNMLTFFLPYGMMMFFYMAIMSSSGMMLNSVSKEKENRTLEVLLVSTNAKDLLFGKILALGLVGLFQMVIWVTCALIMLRLGGQTFNISEAYQLPPSLIAWGVVFFVPGYLVYAALMAGVGALVPNLREASQASFMVIFPLIVPLFFTSAMIESPNGPIAVGLSLFPLTSPTTMMLRLAAVNVPLWQLGLAVGLLFITAFLVARAVAGMFRAQTLMSGQPFKVVRFFKALVGRA